MPLRSGSRGDKGEEEEQCCEEEQEKVLTIGRSKDRETAEDEGSGNDEKQVS